MKACRLLFIATQVATSLEEVFIPEKLVKIKIISNELVDYSLLMLCDNVLLGFPSCDIKKLCDILKGGGVLKRKDCVRDLNVDGKTVVKHHKET